jgi:hypothetical protein
MKSDVGQEMKRTNPAAYYNVLLHKKEHDAIVQQMQAQAQEEMLQQKLVEQEVLGTGKEGPPNKEKKEPSRDMEPIGV